MSDTLDPIVDELTALVALDELTDEQLARGEELIAKAADWRAAETAKAERKARMDALRVNVDAIPTGAVAPFVLPNDAKAIDVRSRETGSQLVKASDVFLGSAAYMQLKSDFPNGVPDSARINLAPTHMGGMKAVLGSVGADGLVAAPDRVTTPTYPWGYPLTLRQLVTNGTTGSDTVEFAQVLAMTNNAAPVEEADASAGSGLKPESVLTFKKVTATVKTIAHWLAATKRALADAGQLRTLIDSFLRFGLEQALENQMVNGDGTGEEFLGILETPGTTDVPFSTSAIETVRKGITAVQTIGLVQPNGVLLNPADAELVDLAADGNERYYGNGPFGTGPNTLWGLPIAVSTAVAAGTAIVADFRQAVLWDRETATITASDSHEDFFTRNLVAVLAELRAAFGIFRPQAFAICDLTAGP